MAVNARASVKAPSASRESGTYFSIERYREPSAARWNLAERNIHRWPKGLPATIPDSRQSAPRRQGGFFGQSEVLPTPRVSLQSSLAHSTATLRKRKFRGRLE